MSEFILTQPTPEREERKSLPLEHTHLRNLAWVHID